MPKYGAPLAFKPSEPCCAQVPQELLDSSNGISSFQDGKRANRNVAEEIKTWKRAADQALSFQISDLLRSSDGSNEEEQSSAEQIVWSVSC